VSDIFVSYASDDKARIKPLVDALQQRGWTVWWDRTILAGRIWEEEIEAALESSRCVVVAWSEASIKSHWVREEAREGMKRGKRGVLVPVLLDRVKIPLGFRGIQAVDLVGWYGEGSTSGFEELARAVAAVLGTSAAITAPAKTGTQPQAGEVRINQKDNLRYVWIPPGKFMMGCSAGDSECSDNENPAHEVSISRGFWIGQTPVTQAAYMAVMPGKPNPSHFKGSDLPVERVTWEEANSYCDAVGMRLLTEAEWEYAARAGTTGARYGDLDQVAWYSGNSGRRTRPVSQKAPNPWALYDMLGNVWEWCSDWYGECSASKQDNPTGPASGEFKVVRGGSWDDYPWNVRVSDRGGSVPASRFLYIGFRCGGKLR
jgi:formylglycine-generating enzyme required for sulfatase activity